jgi:hypothetical protein
VIFCIEEQKQLLGAVLMEATLYDQSEASESEQSAAAAAALETLRPSAPGECFSFRRTFANAIDWTNIIRSSTY